MDTPQLAVGDTCYLGARRGVVEWGRHYAWPVDPTPSRYCTVRFDDDGSLMICERRDLTITVEEHDA